MPCCGGQAFSYLRREFPNGKMKARLELKSPKVSVPLKVNVTELMAELLPDSPSWYNIGSSVTHSIYWGLRDVNSSRSGEPLALKGAALVGQVELAALRARDEGAPLPVGIGLGASVAVLCVADLDAAAGQRGNFHTPSGVGVARLAENPVADHAALRSAM
jgi:hypothetical protein